MILAAGVGAIGVLLVLMVFYKNEISKILVFMGRTASEFSDQYNQVYLEERED